MSKKPPTLIRKHSLEPEKPKGGTYKATDNEIWVTNADGHTHIAVVIRAIDGSLDAHTRKLAKICADALNKEFNEKT